MNDGEGERIEDKAQVDVRKSIMEECRYKKTQSCSMRFPYCVILCILLQLVYCQNQEQASNLGQSTREQVQCNPIGVCMQCKEHHLVGLQLLDHVQTHKECSETGWVQENLCVTSYMIWFAFQHSVNGKETNRQIHVSHSESLSSIDLFLHGASRSERD